VGALVPPDDPAALATAVLAALERRATFDPAALRAHVARFGAAAVAGRIANLYDEVLAEHGAAPRAPSRIAQPQPVARPSDGPVVLVAFDRPALDRHLTGSPPWATAGATIVTAGSPLPGRPDAIVIGGADAAAVSDLLRSSARARSPGVGGLLAAGPRWAVRRWRRYRLTGRVMPLLSAAVDAAIDAAIESSRARGAVAPVLVVCAGGIDVLAGGPARDAGRARIAAGGLRWLGDLGWVRGVGGEPPAAQARDVDEDEVGASAASDA